MQSTLKKLAFVGVGIAALLLLFIAWDHSRHRNLGAYDPNEVMVYGPWGKPTGGLACRALIRAPGIRDGRVTIFMDVKNVSSETRYVDFGSRETNDLPLVSVLVELEPGAMQHTGGGLGWNWSARGQLVRLKPGESAVRIIYKEFWSDEPNRLRAGASLQVQIGPSPTGKGQETRLVSGPVKIAAGNPSATNGDAIQGSKQGTN